MNLKPNTTVVNKHIVFLKDDAGWYADYGGNAVEAPRFSGILGLPLAWLCNQTHRFIGGEHPKAIFIHAITNN